MSEFFSFLVLGIIQGMTYGVVALGMVLIYKGTRVLNFAQPFMGLFAAFLAWYFAGTPGSTLLGTGQGIETGPVAIKWLQLPDVPVPVRRRDEAPLPRRRVLVARAHRVHGWRLEQDIMRHLEKAPRIIALVATIALLLGFASIDVAAVEPDGGAGVGPQGRCRSCCPKASASRSARCA